MNQSISNLLLQYRCIAYILISVITYLVPNLLVTYRTLDKGTYSPLHSRKSNKPYLPGGHANLLPLETDIIPADDTVDGKNREMRQRHGIAAWRSARRVLAERAVFRRNLLMQRRRKSPKADNVDMSSSSPPVRHQPNCRDAQRRLTSVCSKSVMSLCDQQSSENPSSGSLLTKFILDTERSEKADRRLLMFTLCSV